MVARVNWEPREDRGVREELRELRRDLEALTTTVVVLCAVVAAGLCGLAVLLVWRA